ncbi:Syntaxin, N-terminal domain [Dillenia turbinata]|uniref:Syntaxin, N-terminal domain n=1 Tax=Dillenia turbinata TaxID=194707 RepID=A0AAN8Z000_9MAGN
MAKSDHFIHCGALTKWFKELITDFQSIVILDSRQKIQEEYHKVGERRVITGTGSKPDEEVLNTLEEIQERHDAVKEIEKRLLDVHQICLDMAVLVEAQADPLDHQKSEVIRNLRKLMLVTNAVDHVQWGTDALKTAKSMQEISCKCKMIAISLVLIIAILTVLSISKSWKK